MKQEVLEVKIKKQTIKLVMNKFDEDTEVSLDKFLKIDYNNLIAEILTFPAILNRFGIILADIENSLKREEFNFEMEKAKMKKDIRREFDSDRTRPKRSGGATYTKEEVEEQLILKPVYKAKLMSLSELQRKKDIINSVYWSAKSKQDNLNKLAPQLKRDDIPLDSVKEIKEFNGVQIIE